MSKSKGSRSQKLWCGRIELCRWIKTEMRWKRNVLSRSSPETTARFSDRDCYYDC